MPEVAPTLRPFRKLALLAAMVTVPLGPTLLAGTGAASAASAVRTAPAAPAAAAQSSGARCGPAPEGRVAVLMVVDRGTGTPSTRCAIVAWGSTGLDALRATGHSVRLDGGFVCAIDGVPATGCATDDPSLPYWRYWHALSEGGEWSYSNVGAGGYRLPAGCAVEGWSWSDSPSDRTPPRIAAPTPTCEAPATTAAPTTTARPSSGGGAATPSAPATSTPLPPVPPASAGSTGAPGVSAGGPAATTTSPPQVGGVASSRPPDDEDGPAPVSEIEPPDGDAAEDTSAYDATFEGRSDGSTGPDAGSDGEMAVGTSGGGASTPWGVVAAAVLILLLGGASVVRSRARSRHLDPDPT